MVDYVQFCAALSIRHLVVQDADARKPDAAPKVAAVRAAVTASGPLGSLIEFPEDIETSLHAPKDADKIRLQCGTP